MPDEPNVDPTLEAENTPEQSGTPSETDVPSSQAEPQGLSPELLASAKANYNLDDESLSKFDTDDALSEAMTDFDKQLLQPPPSPQNGYGQPSYNPAYPNTQPQVNQQQQFADQNQNQPGGHQPESMGSDPFPELDKEMMDPTQYQALTALQSQYQQVSQAVQMMNNQMQQAETERYLSRYTPLVDNLNDGRLSQSNPNYENNLYQLLSTVENLNQGRASKGMQAMNESDAIQAAYRQFVYYNGSATGLGSQFIGQPSSARQTLAPGDAKAMRTIGNSEWVQGQQHFDEGPTDDELLSGLPD